MLKIQKIEWLFYISIYIMGFIITIICYKILNDITFIYGYLISSIFVFFSMSFGWHFNMKHKCYLFQTSWKKIKYRYIVANALKYVPLILNLLLCILVNYFKIDSISVYGLLVGAIITFVVIVTSDFFKFRIIRNYESLKKEKEV